MACVICGEAAEQEVYRQAYASIAGLGDLDYVHRIVICPGCGYVRASPVPSAELMSRYYRELSNYENPQRQGQASLGDANKWERTRGIVQGRFATGFVGSVLEVGCATGVGLSHFQARGWSVLGNDPSPGAAAIARDLYGIEVIVGMFDAAALASRGRFDAIVLSHVVEHLVSPGELLASLRPLLAPGGIVYIEVPNLLRPYVPMGYFMFEHLSYFTPGTLAALMAGCGFAEDSLASFDNSADIEPFYPVIAATFRPVSGPHLKGMSDHAAALAAIDTYKTSTGREIERLQARIDEVYEQMKGKRLALWGGGLHTSQLLSLVRLAGGAPACIFDNDAKKHGLFLGGVPIVGPPATAADCLRVADGILISSRASEDEIFAQVAWLEGEGVRVFKLYGAAA